MENYFRFRLLPITLSILMYSYLYWQIVPVGPCTSVSRPSQGLSAWQKAVQPMYLTRQDMGTRILGSAGISLAKLRERLLRMLWDMNSWCSAFNALQSNPIVPFSNFFDFTRATLIMIPSSRKMPSSPFPLRLYLWSISSMHLLFSSPLTTSRFTSSMHFSLNSASSPNNLNQLLVLSAQSDNLTYLYSHSLSRVLRLPSICSLMASLLTSLNLSSEGSLADGSSMCSECSKRLSTWFCPRVSLCRKLLSLSEGLLCRKVISFCWLMGKDLELSSCINDRPGKVQNNHARQLVSSFWCPPSLPSSSCSKLQILSTHTIGTMWLTTFPTIRQNTDCTMCDSKGARQPVEECSLTMRGSAVRKRMSMTTRMRLETIIKQYSIFSLRSSFYSMETMWFNRFRQIFKDRPRQRFIITESEIRIHTFTCDHSPTSSPSAQTLTSVIPAACEMNRSTKQRLRQLMNFCSQRERCEISMASTSPLQQYLQMVRKTVCTMNPGRMSKRTQFWEYLRISEPSCCRTVKQTRMLQSC